VLTCYWLPLYAGYTQRSFWQVYDREGSAPFRESNYHPELFVDYTLTWLKDSPWGLRAGIEHESNGQRDPLSRSWNRTYGKVSYATAELGGSVRFWDRWHERAKNPPLTLQGDDNPDLVSYRGSWEAQGVWRLDRVEFSALLRRGKADRGRPWSGQFDLDWMLTRGFALRIEVYRGYGDSLIDYNRDVTRIGIGLALKGAADDLRIRVR
jgi:phospholipase A1